MPLEFGRSGFIRCGEESSYGSASGSKTVFSRINSATLQSTQERERKTFLSQSSAAFSVGHFDVFTVVGGSIELPLFYSGSGIYLKAACGTLTDTSTGGSPAEQHQYIPSANLPSLTIDLQRGTGSLEQFSGCMISTLTISGAAGEEIMMSLDIVAQSATAREASISPSFGTGKQIFHFENDSNKLAYNGSNYAVKNFEFSLDNKLDRRNVLGSKQTLEPAISDVREVTLSVTLEMEDDTLYNAMLAGTVSDVSMKFVRADAELEILLRNCYITEYSDNVNSFGPLERSLVFVGEADSSDEAFEIIIKNAEASGISNN
tara:strand:+ start:35 stop:988 length:954 start_codon:yes stop_codon:yes gene_type:complete